MLYDLIVPRAGDARCIRLLCRPANAQRGGETLSWAGRRGYRAPTPPPKINF